MTFVYLQTSSEYNSTAAVLTLVPKFLLQDQKVELIFVIDRSGSMRGETINKAKDALKVTTMLSYFHASIKFHASYKYDL